MIEELRPKIQDAAAQARRGVRPAPPGHDRRPGRQAQSHRGEDLRRRRGAAGALADAVEARLAKVRGVVDVVGVGARLAGGDLGDRPRRRRAGSASRWSRWRGQLQAAWLGRGGDGASAAGPHRCLCACATPTRCVSIPPGSRAHPCGAPKGVWCRWRDVARPMPSPGEPVLLRENLRQMGLVTARLEGRDLGGAVTDVRRSPCRSPTARRLHHRDRRTVRLGAAGLRRTAAGPGHRVVPGARHPAGRVPSLRPRPVDPRGGAALVRGRPPDAPGDGHRAERVVGDGVHPPGGPGGEERHRDARLRPASRSGRSARPGGCRAKPPGSGCAPS